MNIETEINELAQIGQDGAGVSRFAWTPELASANSWLCSRLRDIGLSAEIDPAGNVIGRWDQASGRAVLVGSHIDTVPCGGRYDGALGVLSGVNAVRRLQHAGFRPSRPIWIAAFNDEEGTRLRTSMLGSRAFTGQLDHDDLANRGVADAMREAGFDFERLDDANAVAGVGAYIELHIEQGPVLDAAGVDIGIVTGIVGMLGLRARFAGEANHAGTTPMDQRHDALAASARAILELRDAARSRSDFVANVGNVAVEPGAANVVPGFATIEIDLRAPTNEALARAGQTALSILDAAALAEGVKVETTEVHRKDAVALDDRLQNLIIRAAEAEGATYMTLPSGAGHDAMVLAQKVPAAMIFVPSRDGISHSPREFTSAEACARGVDVLTRALQMATDAESEFALDV